MGGTLALYVARHGETDWNRVQRVQGSIDVPLNAEGERQAAALAKSLAHVTFDHIYTSNLQRTVATAAAWAPQIPRTRLAELDEQALGRFEGRYLDGRDPDTLAAYRARVGVPHDKTGGGESADDHLQRVTRGLSIIRDRHVGGTVLVVAHGGTNRQVARSLLALDYAAARTVRQRNAALWLFELDGVAVKAYGFAAGGERIDLVDIL